MKGNNEKGGEQAGKARSIMKKV